MAKSMKILITDYVWPDLEPEKKVLEPNGIQIVVAPDGSEETLIALARDVDGILTCFAKVTDKVVQKADKLKVIAMADSEPLVPNTDEYGKSIPENQAKNRRVEIFINKFDYIYSNDK